MVRRRRKHSAFKFAVVAFALMAIGGVSPSGSVGRSELTIADGVVGRDGVKIRRMYLVRPDLIPYRMQFAAYA